MKNELKDIILMGLGAISLTGEKASSLKEELLKKGQEVYKEGQIKNEELKRNIKETIKENVTVQVTPGSEEELQELIGKMDKEELKRLEKLVKEAKDKENKKQN